MTEVSAMLTVALQMLKNECPIADHATGDNNTSMR